MASDGTKLTWTREAGADLSAKQFFAVKVNSDGKIVLAGAGEPVVGILQNDPTSGQAGTVAFLGVSKAKSGGSITAGDRVAADANGKLVTATAGRTNTANTGTAADPLIGSNVIGTALTGASDGDIFTVLINQPGAIPTTAA